MKLLLALALIASVVLAGACGGSGTTAQRSPSATAPLNATTSTPEGSLVKPVAQDGEIWDQVLAFTSAYISPILRPTGLPDGFDTVTLVRPAKPDRYGFAVEYVGLQKRLQVEVGKYNLPLPGPPGHQEKVQIRGLRCNSGTKDTVCFLQTEDDANPNGWVWLAWNEPGRWEFEQGLVQRNVEYLLAAQGLTQQEVLAIAEALRPTAPP